MNALIIGDEHCVGLEYVFDDIFQKEDITWYNKSAPGMGNEYISSMLFEWDNTIKTIVNPSTRPISERGRPPPRNQNPTA